MICFFLSCPHCVWWCFLLKCLELGWKFIHRCAPLSCLGVNTLGTKKNTRTDLVWYINYMIWCVKMHTSSTIWLVNTSKYRYHLSLAQMALLCSIPASHLPSVSASSSVQNPSSLILTEILLVYLSLYLGYSHLPYPWRIHMSTGKKCCHKTGFFWLMVYKCGLPQKYGIFLWGSTNGLGHRLDCRNCHQSSWSYGTSSDHG